MPRVSTRPAGEPAPAQELRFRSLQGAELERFLQRQKAVHALPGEIDLGAQLRVILEKARELVPSESGSILLDDPLLKVDTRSRNDLYFVTAFGPSCDELPGTRIAATAGIAGKVYRTGRSHLATDVRADAAFSPQVDHVTGHRTRSVVAAPIAIGSTVCGVIELVDRVGGGAFSEHDLALLEIFAGYTSSTLQNALDAKRANELARRDDLTGLYNDRWMHHSLGVMIEASDQAGVPCALIFFDLDHFKNVNDTHGHLAGSQVLREVGYLLRRTVAHPAAILARYGGDEFVIGLPGAGLDAAADVAEQIRAAIAAATYLDRPHGPQLPPVHLTGSITASVGVAVCLPAPAGDPAHVREQALLRDADAAMYAAKAAGKNTVVAWRG